MAGTLETTAPIARFRWLKRFAVCFAVLLLLLTGLRLYWGHAMQSKVDKLMAEIHAKGEPIYAEDLEFQPVEDHENAAKYLMQALNRWPTVPGTYQRIDDTDWYLEGPEEGHADPISDNTAYLGTCKPALDLVRQAAELEQVDWIGQPLPSNYDQFTNTAWNNLSDRRRLARLMWDAADRAFNEGQTHRAVEILKLIQDVGDKSTLQPTGIIDFLVGNSIHVIVNDTIQSKLSVVPLEQLREPETRAELVDLLNMIRDETTMWQSMQESLLLERWGNQRYIEQRIDGSLNQPAFYGTDPYADLLLDTPVLRQAFAPLFNHTLLYQLENATNEIERITQTDNARDAVASSQGPDPEEVYFDRPWLYPIIGEFWFTSQISTIYRQIATRRMAATAIAIRLYQADHDGDRPETLEALVPEYLPSVPIDPYVGDRPIGYKPQGVVPKTYDEFKSWLPPLTNEQRAALPIRPFPLLYCVDMDFEDNGGLLVISEYSGTLDYYNNDADEQDRWFLLVPEPEPLDVRQLRDWLDEESDDASETGEDDINEESDQGQDPEDQGG